MSLIAWPTTNDVGGGGKGNVITEGYWESLAFALGGVGAFCSWGYTVTTSGLTATLSPGVAVVYGSVIHNNADYPLTLTANAVNYCWMEVTFDQNFIQSGGFGNTIYATGCKVTAVNIRLSTTRPPQAHYSAFGGSWESLYQNLGSLALFQATTNASAVTLLTDRKPTRNSSWTVPTFT